MNLTTVNRMSENTNNKNCLCGGQEMMNLMIPTKINNNNTNSMSEITITNN